MSGDVVVFAAGLWDQPWLTEHHLARALARRRRVLLVDGWRTPVYAARQAEQPLSGLKDLVRRHTTEEEGLTVLRPVSLPPARHRRAEAASWPLLRAQVRRALRRGGLRPGLVVAARPTAPWFADLTPGATRVALVKDWLQAGTHLTGRDPAATRRLEHEEWAAADLVCAVSRPLVAQLEADGFPAHLLRQGFSLDLAGPEEELDGSPPAALADLPRPIIGSVGRIDARLAYDELERVADAHPEGSLVLVGPIAPLAPAERLSRLLDRPNVHHLPAVPTRAVPHWVASMDCALIPYLADEWQRYAAPIKVWDYLYAGTPIAATGAPSLADLPAGLLHTAVDHRELPDLVARALGEGRPGRRADRRAFARASSWDARAEQLLDLVAAQ